MLGAVPRGWQIQAYLSTDVDRITVAKPFTECNIVFAMFLQCTPMSSTLLLTVSTRLLVRMNGGLFSTLYFVLLLPAARQDDVLPCNRTKQHTQQPVGCFVCVGASCDSSQTRERICPRMVRTRVKFFSCP